MISSAIWNNDTQVFCFFCFFLKSNNESSKKFNSPFFNSNHPKGLSGFFIIMQRLVTMRGSLIRSVQFSSVDNRAMYLSTKKSQNNF